MFCHENCSFLTVGQIEVESLAGKWFSKTVRRTFLPLGKYLNVFFWHDVEIELGTYVYTIKSVLMLQRLRI